MNIIKKLTLTGTTLTALATAGCAEPLYDQNNQVEQKDTNSGVPEPSTYCLLVTGAITAGAYVLKKKGYI